MYLIYQPEGSEEPTSWEYNPRKIMSAEREMLERRTDRTFAAFTKDVIQGSSVCRRALLFMYLKRDAPGIRYDDVDFAWDELRLEHSKGELRVIRDSAADAMTGDERAAVLAQLDQEIEEAPEGPEGKVLPPVVA